LDRGMGEGDMPHQLTVCHIRHTHNAAISRSLNNLGAVSHT
jgi:hypothetical protein